MDGGIKGTEHHFHDYSEGLQHSVIDLKLLGARFPFWVKSQICYRHFFTVRGLPRFAKFRVHKRVACVAGLPVVEIPQKKGCVTHNTHVPSPANLAISPISSQ